MAPVCLRGLTADEFATVKRLAHSHTAPAQRVQRAQVIWRASCGESASVIAGMSGLRSDDVRGRSFAPRGRTPVVRLSHKRAGLGPISAVTNKGELPWMVLEGALKAPSLIRFLGRLIQDADGKVFLIWDNLPVHRARAVQDWLAERTEQIEVFSPALL